MRGIKKWLAAPVSDTQITRGGRLWLYALVALIVVFLAAPSLIVMPMSFSGSQYLEFPPREWSTVWYRRYFDSPLWLAATATSFKAALLTMFVATPLGVLAAYGLYTCSFGWRRYLFLLLISPMMVPIILIAVAVFYVFVKLQLVNTLFGIVLAHSVLALPLVIIVVVAGLKTFDMNQERVARSLGASRARAFLTVTLPQIRFSVISGALLAFLTSFDEVIVALFIAGSENATITRIMFLALRDQIDPTIASISTIIIVLTIALLLVSQLFGKKPEE